MDPIICWLEPSRVFLSSQFFSFTLFGLTKPPLLPQTAPLHRESFRRAARTGTRASPSARGWQGADALKVPPQCSWICSFPRELPNGMGLQPPHAGDGQRAPLSSPPLAWFLGRKEPISSHQRAWKCLWGCHQARQRRARHLWPGSDRAEKPEAQQQGGSCRAGHNAPLVDGQSSTETVLRAKPCHRCRSHVLINKNKYLTSRKRSFV